jgi:hypothetical protein
MSVTRRPSLLAWAALLTVTFLVLLVGAQAAVLRQGRVVEITVPAGTQAQLDRGDTVAVMPARLELRVGDRLRITNNDVTAQWIGPYLVSAGQVMEISYGAPGTYEGICGLTAGYRFELVITP